MVSRILIVKTSAIGDIIHALPVVEYLKKRFPGAKIDWVVEKAGYDLLLAHGDLTRVLLFDSKSWRKEIFKTSTWSALRDFFRELKKVPYDLLFDLQGNTKSALITLAAKAEMKVGFDWKTVAEKPNYFATHKRYAISRKREVRSRYLELIQAHCKDSGKDPHPFSSCNLTFTLTADEAHQLTTLLKHPLFAKPNRWMVAFGSNWKNKRLDPETLKKFLKTLHDKYQFHFFFPFGNKEEEILATELLQLFPETSLIIGKLSLNLWQTVMKEMEGVIAMDSAALHLCGTTQVPSFSFFGPSASEVYKPLGEHHGAFQGECPYGRTFEVRCPALRTCSSGACLKEASLEDILLQFDHWNSRSK